jgi:hypothetical protein
MSLVRARSSSCDEGVFFTATAGLVLSSILSAVLVAPIAV